MWRPGRRSREGTDHPQHHETDTHRRELTMITTTPNVASKQTLKPLSAPYAAPGAVAAIPGKAQISSRHTQRSQQSVDR